ncbi:MAG: glycosyltransferase family 2 protein [Streptococcaceae bacterium]|nr:glycosyltransferase family 2 protein [Streptococcaceae bacterium]
MENKKVAIIISTYNGEKYLEEQLDSIINQTYENLLIYIRDDGSSDNTRKILERYRSLDSRIQVEFAQNIGYCRSFFSMLEKVEADYYAFCDQDDIWKSTKISIAIKDIENKERGQGTFPVLWFSNIELCDAEMNLITLASIKKFYTFENSLFTCAAPGMAMVINKEARKKIISKNIDTIKEHDFWVYRVCSALGEIVYNKEALVKYRRHGNNVSDYSYNFLQRYYLGFKRLFLTDIYKNTKKEIILFSKLYRDNLSEEKKKTIELFSDYHLKARIRKTFFNKRLKDNPINEILIRVLLLFGGI